MKYILMIIKRMLYSNTKITLFGSFYKSFRRNLFHEVVTLLDLHYL